MTAVPCQYCGTATNFSNSRECTACWEVTSRIDFFVCSDAGLIRALEAVSKRPPMPAGASSLTEAIALGTSGQAGSAGQLLAVELLVLQTTLERVRAETEQLRKDEAASVSLALVNDVVIAELKAKLAAVEGAAVVAREACGSVCPACGAELGCNIDCTLCEFFARLP